VVDGLVVEQVGGDDSLDNLLQDLLAEVLGADLLGVLSRDDYGIDTDRDDSPWALGILLVLDGNLGLGLKWGISIRLLQAASLTHVRSEPSKVAVAALLGHLSVEGMRENQSQGHELLGLAASNRAVR
jgi:hypothetical protein